MKIKILELLILIVFSAIQLRTAIAQDVTPFELIDNASVGLTVAPFSKWGMAVGDINKDGYPEIFTIRWNGDKQYSRLYLNLGGTFQDISQQTPLPQIEGQSIVTETRNSVFVDFDNDGDQDISISQPKELYLLRNDGNTFVDVSAAMGFKGKVPPGFISSWSYTVGGWADYDLDGDLDCIVSQENNKNIYLFRNDGDRFTNVATQAGLDSTELSARTRLSWFDFDLDGYPDIYSDYHFFRNDNGVFVNVTEEIGLSGLNSVAYREFLDYDNDGDFDFFKVVGSATDPATNEMWENRDGYFVNVTEDVGLSIDRDRYRSLTIGDCDNDGDVDIFVQLNIDPSFDVLLINDEVAPGERAFANVADIIGITKTGDRKGSAFLDYDKDGWLDIYLPSAEHNHILYRNLGGNGANWVVFMLEGTVSNKDAVGTLVKIYTGDKMQVRYTKAGNGWLRQDNPHVHFGLGFATGIDSVVIRWPLGYKQVLTDITINQYHQIKEPEQTSVELKPVGKKSDIFQLGQNYPNPFNPTTSVNYQICGTRKVNLTIYDITGHQVRTLVDCQQEAGHYSVSWNGQDDQGHVLPSGVYVYRLIAGRDIMAKKMLYVK